MTGILIVLCFVLCFVVAVEAIALNFVGKRADEADTKAEAAQTMVINTTTYIRNARAEIDDDINDVRLYITEVKSELLEKIESLQDKYDAADEMIRQVTRTAEEAQETEKKMQDGIDAILNYNSQKAINEILR